MEAMIISKTANSTRIPDIQANLNNITRTTFGISVPELRKYAKKIAENDYKSFLELNTYESFELKLLHAFVIGYAKDDVACLLKYFKNFIPYVDSWEVCDSLCQNFKIARNYPEKVWHFIHQYKDSEKEFESRIVSVILLSHYLTDDYIDSVIITLDSLNTDDYYAQMGVAWAIATAMAKYPEKCLDYLSSEACHLSPVTYNLSLKKIKESLRVPNQIKQLTNTMKK